MDRNQGLLDHRMVTDASRNMHAGTKLQRPPRRLHHRASCRQTFSPPPTCTTALTERLGRTSRKCLASVAVQMPKHFFGEHDERMDESFTTRANGPAGGLEVSV